MTLRRRIGATLVAMAMVLVAGACGVPREDHAREVPGARFVVPTTQARP